MEWSITSGWMKVVLICYGWNKVRHIIFNIYNYYLCYNCYNLPYLTTQNVAAGKNLAKVGSELGC